jgi:hypothetical protein
LPDRPIHGAGNEDTDLERRQQLRWLYIANPIWGLAVDDQDTEDDADGDKLSNILKAWLGTHPGQANQLITSLSSTASMLTFTHPQNENPPGDLTGYYEWSPNLSDWYASGSGPNGGLTVTFVPNTSGAVTTVTATANEASDKMFIRAGGESKLNKCIVSDDINALSPPRMMLSRSSLKKQIPSSNFVIPLAADCGDSMGRVFYQGTKKPHLYQMRFF